MKRLFAEFFFAAIILLAMVSCGKDYYEDKYGDDSAESELFAYLEGDWEVVHEFSWGYYVEYYVSDGIVDLESGTLFKETGEDNGPVRKDSELYYAVRFKNGLSSITATGNPYDLDLIGAHTPYYITEGNRLHGSLFHGDVAQYVQVKIIDANTMQFRVDDVGICREYNCGDYDHDGVILKHTSACELIGYSEDNWHQIKTLKRIRKVPVAIPPEGWMTYIDDSALLTQISIPGSHASATYYGLYNDLAYVTQRVKLEGQWDAGVRAFDFTVASDGGLSFKDNALEKSFRDMVEILQEKLMICKQDVAIVFVRPEDGVSESQLQQWRDYVGDVISDLDDAAAIWTPMMTMRQSRGRIIFVLDEEFTWNGKKDQVPGVRAVREGNMVSLTSMSGGNSEKMYVQDVSGVSHTDKLSAIFENMKLSMTFDNKDVEENVWMVNSLALRDEGYLKGAIEIIPMVYGFLSGIQNSAADSGEKWQKTEEGPLGIVMMDFVSEESDEISASILTEEIILNNYNYKMKTRSNL